MTETVEGEVYKIGIWGSGKGYFITMDRDSRDYYVYGSPICAPGDRVRLHITPGEKDFKGKFKVGNIEKLKESGLKPPAPREQGPAPYDREQEIKKQCCMKAAARIVGDLTDRNMEISQEGVINEVRDYTKAFLKILEEL